MSLSLCYLLCVHCAAHRAYNRGLRAERAERYNDAIRNYSEASARDPNNPRYRMALSDALVKGGDAHVRRGEAFENAGETELAYNEFCLAVQENPLNDRALLKRDILHRQLLAAALPPKTPKRPPIPSPLDALSKKPVTLKMTEAELSEVFLSIERLTGIGFIYDDAFKSRKVTVNFQNMSFREVLERLMVSYHLFGKPIDPRTILIAPDSPAKRDEYEEQILKTFYMRNADVTKVAANLKSLVDLKRVMIDPELKALTIRDTAEKLELARRLIEKVDLQRAEVVVDLEILEFNRNRLRSYGLDFSSYAVGGAIALEPKTELPAGSLIRGHMLGNLALSDVLFSVPSVVYRLLRTDTRTRLIARPQLRAAEGKTVSIKVGEKVPIPITTFISYTGGGVNNQPITSFQLTDIGLQVEITPEVFYNNEVSLNTKFDLSSVVREGTANLPPTLGNRSVQTTIRLRDGETTLIAGLIKEEERHSRTGLPGISELPVIGHLFASNQDSGGQSDILLTLTPHIVRMAEIDEDEQHPIWVGTEHALHVSDEPPPYATQREGEAPAEPAQRGRTSPPGAGEGEAPAEPAMAPETQSTPTPAVPTLGDATLTIDPLDIRVPVGVQFSIRISVRASPAFASCAFDLPYDPDLLEAGQVDPGRSIHAGFTTETKPGGVSVRFDAGRDFDGTACRMIFTAKKSGSLTLALENIRVTDSSGNPFAVTAEPASVRIGGGEAEKTTAQLDMP